ncbi:MAG: c-type cytochrome [Sulfurimonas sp.]|nr:c-type cytochrome [Sulfurimonas sp.]
MMPTTTTPTASGESIYKVCATCHGLSGEKAALGKSQIIKGWSASKVSDALKGYKADSYGGAMKGIMKGQASKLSDSDIKAVAEYISKF